MFKALCLLTKNGGAFVWELPEIYQEKQAKNEQDKLKKKKIKQDKNNRKKEKSKIDDENEYTIIFDDDYYFKVVNGWVKI